MKSKKKLGAATLIVGGIVGGSAIEANAQSGAFSDNPEGTQNDTLSIIPGQLIKVDESGLKQRLQKLATVKGPKNLFMGAMCYDMIGPMEVDYICPVCHHISTTASFTTYENEMIKNVRKAVQSMKNLGYDAVLDETEYCQYCSHTENKKPELIFKIRFSPNEEYHIAKSNIENEYKCVLAFLSNHAIYDGYYDEQHYLGDNIGIITKMTGLKP